MLNLPVHFALDSMDKENYVFGGEFQYEFLNVSQTFYTFFSSALKKKSQNAPLFEMDFVLNFAMCSVDFTYVNGSTIRIVLCKLL